jgi:hypothetical protein|tara:strand:- start:1868 stop:2227 length:360 start_codon:yes stop_codon:yes gene_type:complete
MPIIDTALSSLDKTVQIFDSFYQFDVVISANEYEIINSYFKGVTGSNDIARNFSAFLFRISFLTGEPVLTLLSYIKGKSKLEVNALMAYFLNGIKSKTTLYGVGTVPKSNEPVQRNIVI